MFATAGQKDALVAELGNPFVRAPVDERSRVYPITAMDALKSAARGGQSGPGKNWAWAFVTTSLRRASTGHGGCLLFFAALPKIVGLTCVEIVPVATDIQHPDIAFIRWRPTRKRVGCRWRRYNSRWVTIWSALHSLVDGWAGAPANGVRSTEAIMGNRLLEERDCIDRLKAGDECEFGALYSRHTPSMIRVAATIVNSRAAAEEVTQEAWLAVLKNIDGFEGRSSLASWIFTIVINKARTRAKRDGRSVSFDEGGVENNLAAAFDGHGRWKEMPELWEEITPERITAGRRLAEHMREAIDALPPAQRAVIVLRVQQGLNSAEVCEILGVSDGNMRVLLHRARLSLRARLAELS